MAAKMEHVEELRVCLRAGTSMVENKPLFSSDSKLLFCGCGSAVHVYSAGTGLCLRKLHHSQPLSGFALHPSQEHQIITSTCDGEVCIWDVSDGNLLKTQSVGFPIRCLVDVSADGCSLYLVRSQRGNSTKSGHELVRYGLGSKSSQVLIAACHTEARRAVVGPKEKFVACVFKDKLKLWTPRQKRDGISHSGGTQFELTCVTSHPEGHCLATGRSDGQILIWWNFLCVKTVETTKMHWHSLSLRCLQYTRDGALLLSGGGECVLVQWRHNSTDRTFLPRLGSPLQHIAVSPDTTTYATCHQDNSIRIIGHNLVVRHVLVGLTVAGLCGEAVPVATGLLCEPRSRALVLNGQPGHLQFYDVHRDQHLFNLDILGQNYVSWDSRERPESVTQVTGATFSPAGDWLATVERWDDGQSSPETSLRLWQYSSSDKQYVLNTLVEQPHEERAVTCLRFRQPSRQKAPLQLVSVGEDGKFRLWKLVDDTDIYRENSKWTCEYVGHWRQEMPRLADFSADGSVLAVSFGATVTLWEPDFLQFHRDLTDYRDSTTISQLAFGHHSASDLIITASAKRLTVWKPLLLTGPILWSMEMEVAVLTLDPLSDIFAAITKDRKLQVYLTGQSEPLYHHHQELSAVAISGAVFVPRAQGGGEEGEAAPWQRLSELCVLTERQELLSLLSPAQLQLQQQAEDAALVSVVERSGQSALSQLISGQRVGGTRPTGPSTLEHTRQERNRVFKRLCAEYTAPSLSSSLAWLVRAAQHSRPDLQRQEVEMDVVEDGDSIS